MMQDRWPWIAVAVVLLLVLAALIEFSPPPSRELDVRVPPGAGQVLELPDGSTVTLAPDSRLTGKFLGRSREVHIPYGEAFFRVAHDRRRPFEVYARYKRIIALGTEFDVRVRNRIIRVAVIEGAVSIEKRRSSGPAMRLTAGRQATFHPGDDSAVTEAADPAEVMSWMSSAPVAHRESPQSATD